MGVRLSDEAVLATAAGGAFFATTATAAGLGGNGILGIVKGTGSAAAMGCILTVGLAREGVLLGRVSIVVVLPFESAAGAWKDAACLATATTEGLGREDVVVVVVVTAGCATGLGA
jgi:hypothetical protein